MFNYLRFILIFFCFILTSGCYTIINSPDQNTLSLKAEKLSSDTIVNNYYSCMHKSRCCRHSYCHSFTYHSCNGYCHHSYNWWSGTYHYSSYSNNWHHNNYSDGYYHGYYDGFNWWNEDNNSTGNYSTATNTQSRRGRSFNRTNNSDNSTLISGSNLIEKNTVSNKSEKSIVKEKSKNKKTSKPKKERSRNRKRL